MLGNTVIKYIGSSSGIYEGKPWYKVFFSCHVNDYKGSNVTGDETGSSYDKEVFDYVSKLKPGDTFKGLVMRDSKRGLQIVQFS